MRRRKNNLRTGGEPLGREPQALLLISLQTSVTWLPHPLETTPQIWLRSSCCWGEARRHLLLPALCDLEVPRDHEAGTGARLPVLAREGSWLGASEKPPPLLYSEAPSVPRFPAFR